MTLVTIRGAFGKAGLELDATTPRSSICGTEMRENPGFKEEWKCHLSVEK
jgi:hypothetical protein